MARTLAVASIVIVGCVVAAVLAATGMYMTPEGHVSLTFFGGKLSRSYRTPGYHWSPPLISSTVHIPVRMQTSVVRNIECGTSSGVVMYFDALEVVHLLRATAAVPVVAEYSAQYDQVWVHDRLAWEVSQICSKHTLQEIYIDKFDQIDEMVQHAMNQGTPDGLEIIAVRVTKPTIPDIVRVNYERVESLKARLLVVEQHEHNVLRKEETLRRQAVIEAQKNWQVSNITMQRRLDAAASIQTIQEIEDKMVVDRQRQHANAAFYQTSKQAEANRRRITPEFLQLMWSRAMLHNTKMFLGPDVPPAVVEEPALPRLPTPHVCTGGTCRAGDASVMRNTALHTLHTAGAAGIGAR